MSTQIVKCDQCGKVVEQTEAHGWLNVRVWVTRPTQEQLDEAMASPAGRAHVSTMDVKPAPVPAMVGGDFHNMPCLIKYYKEQEAVRTAVESPGVEPDRSKTIAPEPPDQAHGPSTLDWNPDNKGYL